jgi:hypothetical protein
LTECDAPTRPNLIRGLDAREWIDYARIEKPDPLKKRPASQGGA